MIIAHFFVIFKTLCIFIIIVCKNIDTFYIVFTANLNMIFKFLNKLLKLRHI